MRAAASSRNTPVERFIHAASSATIHEVDLALGLVLASAFLHALWNALLKQQPDVEIAAVGVLCVAFLSSLAITPWFPGAPFPEHRGLAWAVGAGVFEGGYFISLALALLRAPLGYAYTVARGTAIGIVWPTSVIWLGERFGFTAITGVIILCLGLLVVGLEKGAHASGPGFLWSFACGLCVSGYHLCYKEALAANAQAPALFSLSLAIAVPLNLWRLRVEGRLKLWRRMRESPRAMLLTGIACTASFVVFLHALAIAGAGWVLTMRNTSILFAQGLALLIGERLTRRQIAGAALVALGALLTAWP